MRTSERPDYQRIKVDAARRSRANSRAGRDIGSIPPIADVGLRRECDASLKVFCEELFPQRFNLAWSVDHLRVFELMQNTIETGGRIALAMPRGSGKSSITECGLLWAMLTARHWYVMGIGPSKDDAKMLLDHIKDELCENEHLLTTYPGVCYPFQSLEGEARRAAGQLHYGQRTGIGWGEKLIRFPTIPGEPSSGAMLKIAGIEGGIRGARVRMPDGSIERPTLAAIDDIQTEESAWSETQCEQRRRTIEGAIANLSGPQKSVALILPCTVIRGGDLADTLLDRKQNPIWRGVRTKFIYEWPKRADLWERYAELRVQSFDVHEDSRLANDFYRDNRKKMDAGARVAWPPNFERDKGEISAIQRAYNLLLKDEAAFYAEYQNEPIDINASDLEELKPEQIRERTNGHKQRTAPLEAELLTVGIDVHKNALIWSAVAWSKRFDGWTVDYGAYPDQKRDYFTLRQAKRTLARAKPGAGQEAQIYAGLEQLVEDLYARPVTRDDGTLMVPDLILIDANWGVSTDIVHRFARATSRPVLPSHGRFYGASTNPLSARRRARGDLQGINWFVPKAAAKSAQRHIVFDTNFWKSFIAQRLLTPIGDRGAMTLWGKDPSRHRMYSEWLTAEARVRVEAKGRTVDQWSPRRPGLDNHLLDTEVMCAVAASYRGAAITDAEQRQRRPKKRVKRRLSDELRAKAS